VDEFLSKLKLEQFSSNFEVNNITNLKDVTDEVLKNIGLDKIGHRKRILTELKNIGLIEGNAMSVNNNHESNHNELPPGLPPKSRSISQHPTPPSRVMSSRPPKPPRINSSIARTGSLPSGVNLNNENYHVMSPVPPVPPREDLGEKNSIGGTSPVSPKRKAPPPPIRTSIYYEHDVDIDESDHPPNFTPPPPPIPAPRKLKGSSSDIPTIMIGELQEEPDELEEKTFYRKYHNILLITILLYLITN